MRRLKKLFRASAIILIAGFILAYTWLSLTEVSAKDLPPLKNGDIIFQSSRSSQSTAILAASRSAYTHMGIIQLGTDDAPSVVEAVGPVKTTPLDEWIKRGMGHRITIKRMEALSPEWSGKVLTAAHKYDGLPYDIFFLPGKNEIYCSELVRLAFSEGANIALGQPQKVKELRIDNFAARKLIEKRWHRHPLCQKADQETFQSCYAKILEQELVTPASIAADPRLKTIFSNFGLLTE
jgi:Permuted papain-like amidase enzyme, YaeF/YiiX, C92 family